MRFGFLVLFVPDVAAALTFYEHAFGTARRFIHESGNYGELQTGETSLAFAVESTTPVGCRLTRPNKSPPAAEIAFVTDNVYAGFARAVDAGATVVSRPELKPWGQTVSYVRDLNGFLVEICTPAAVPESRTLG